MFDNTQEIPSLDKMLSATDNQFSQTITSQNLLRIINQPESLTASPLEHSQSPISVRDSPEKSQYPSLNQNHIAGDLETILQEDIKNYLEVFDNIQLQLKKYLKKTQKKIAIL